jgi:transposase InsO family protein
VFAPKDIAEAAAIFRAQVIGPLLTREFTSHGELARAIRALSRERYRAPGSNKTRSFSPATIERWYYRYRKGGLPMLEPRRRSDRGHARKLTPEQRELLLAIRREHPTVSAALIVRTLELDGRLERGSVSLPTVRRLYGEHGLDRVSLRTADGRVRLRWQADRVDALWHADVCHGPAMRIGERTVPLRIHALLDDHSRYVIAIQATSTEREIEMLSLLVKAMRKTTRRPESLYLDNGPTYTGDALETFCARASIALLHAQPHDPQARGKMERFWRTLREGCLDHLGAAGSLHDVQVRLLAFLDQHYHKASHASLMGKSPGELYENAPRFDKPISELDLALALTMRAKRRVRRDGTVEVGGTTFQSRAGFLAGRIVTVARNLIDPTADPWIEDEDRSRFLLERVDPEENARRKVRGPRSNRPLRGLDIPFDPPGALLDALVKRTTQKPRGAR